jgi:hypothetical protein
MRQSAIVLSAALCALLFLPGCSQGRGHEVLAAALAIQGKVFCGKIARDNFRAMSPGTLVGAGESIRVPKGAQLDIALLPGLLLRVSGDSEFVIGELKLTKDGNETEGLMVYRSAHVQFSRGQATLSFQLPQGSVGEVTVGTSHAAIRSEVDSLFRIETDNDSTRAVCVRGEIHAVDTSAHPSVIKQGSLQNWGMRRATPMARADAPLQTEIDGALRTEAELLTIDPPESFRAR